jgi:prepilin-type N-terminal cleavage/methylation domain-containing protein
MRRNFSFLGPLPRGAFSLIELLVVVAIVGILTALVVPAFNGIGSARSLSKAGADVLSILEQARTYAMANNTYVWVGLQPEGDNLVAAVVASKTGRLTAPAEPQDASDLVEISPLRRWNGVALEVIPNSNGRPPSDLAGQLASLSTPIRSFSTASGGGMRNFDKFVVQFDKVGAAKISQGNAVRVIEIGLMPRFGSSSNYAAVQIGGLTGGVKVYRP